MIGIARALPTMAESCAVRLTRALAGTSVPQDGTARQADLVAKRDALLALVGQAA